MNVLSISLDESIAVEGSEAYRRQRAYARHFERYVVVVKTSPDVGERIEDGPLEVVPSESRSRYTFLLDAYRLGVRTARDRPFDVVTTQTPFALGVVGAVLARRLGAELYVQVHTDFLENDAWRTASIEHRIKGQLGRFVLQRADRVRVGTAYEGKKLSDYLGENSDVRVAPVRMSFERFDASPGAVTRLSTELDCRNRPVVLFAGRFVPVKNFDKWLSVASRVRELVDEDPVFLLVGDGPEQERIETASRELGLEDDLRLTGWVDHEQIGAYYSLADVFLITSEYEGTSRVVVEAGMAELPVVTTPFAGSYDNVDHGVTGFIAETPETLAAHVATLLNDPERRAEMGRNARDYLSDRFDADRLTREYLSFLTPGDDAENADGPTRDPGH